MFTEVVILNADLRATQIWSKYSSLKVVLFFSTKINLGIHRCHNSLPSRTLQEVRFSVPGKLPLLVLSVFLFQLIHSLPKIHYENKKKKNLCFKCCFTELIRRTALLNTHFPNIVVKVYFRMRLLLKYNQQFPE